MARRRLVVFGDSWVQGQRKHPKLEITPYNMVYHLGRKLDCKVENMGKFGASNEAIANEAIRYINNNDTSDIAFFVCFSEHKRIVELSEHVFRDNKRIFDFDRWQVITGGSSRLEAIRVEHFPHFRHPSYHRLCFENSLHCLRMLCQDYGIPVLFSNSIDTSSHIGKVRFQGGERPIRYELGKANEQWIEGDKPNNALLDILSDRWLREDIKDLPFQLKLHTINNDFLRDPDKYPMLSLCIHPTDEGHEYIADTLAPYIRPILEK